MTVGRSSLFLRRAAWLLTGTGALALGLPLTAVAQSGRQGAEQADPGFAEIIVTANRREERGQDVPIAITAFSPERLTQQNISKEQDLQASVPSLVVGPNGQGSRDSQSFTIRGQGATFQASPGVAVYLNEVPLPGALTLSQQGGPGNFVDLENLQVLAGPQGTLFGRNTTGGAVLLVPKKPTNNFSGWLQGRIGNYDRREIEGALNIPLIDEKLLVRVVGAFHDRDGYTRDIVWNKDRDDEHWYSGRIGVTFRPTETIENYTMLYGSQSDNNGAGLIHSQFNIDGLKAFGMCYDGPTIPNTIASCNVYRAATAQAEALGPRQTALSVDLFQQTKTWGIHNTTTIELNDELTLRNIFAYQKLKIRYRYDGDGTVLQQHEVDPGVLPGPGQVLLPGDGTPVTYLNSSLAKELPRDRYENITEELQLQGNYFDNKLNLTVGGFYYDQRPDGAQGSSAITYCPAAFTGLCGSSTAQSSVRQKSNALYAQGTFDFGAFSPALESLRLTAGYRHTWDEITGSAFQYQADLNTPGNVVCGIDPRISVPEANGATACGFSAKLNSKASTWVLGLDYKVKPGVLLFGKVSRGYKSGGFNPYAVFLNTQTFAPETVTSYEVGVKSDFRLADVPFRLNVTGYSLDFKDIQRGTGDFNPQSGAGGARTNNADARIKGIELEGSMRPFQGFEVGGNFSYTDAKYKKYQYVTNSGTVDCNGPVAPGGIADSSCIPFQYTAKYIYSIHASAEHELGNDMGTIALFMNYSHSSSQYTEPVNIPALQPGTTLAPFGLLSASLDWRSVGGSGADIGLFITNATNKLYRISNSNGFQQGGLLVNETLYGEPRMYGLRVKYKFGGE